MKIYILQEDYTEYVPEDGWDENGSYDGYIQKYDVIGVFLTLEDIIKKLAKVLLDAKQESKKFYIEERRPLDYNILIADTDTSDVEMVRRDEYEQMLKQALKEE